MSRTQDSNAWHIDSKTLCRKDTSLWEEGQACEEMCSLQDKWENKNFILV
jgi:hypothetical protein